MVIGKTTELDSIDLGDKRLNSRAKTILKRFTDSPNSGINGSFNGWKESKAAYRFFDNPKVSADRILEPHKDATLNRIGAEKIVLCVQDTTIVDYSHRKARVEGLGNIRKKYDQGFLLHPTVAFSGDGLCLGVINYKAWARHTLQGKKMRNVKRDIKDKESIRWLESYQVTDAIAKANPETLVINVADREGDFYEFLQQFDCRTTNAHILVRAKSDRVIEAEEKKLWTKLRSQPAIGKITFQLERICTKRRARTVTQTVKACSIKLKPPRKVKNIDTVRPITINAILCTEDHPPAGEKAVEWMLLTTLDCGKSVKALDIVRYYSLRWGIEVYFKTLKSGCKIEELQLEDIRRMQNCIALYMIVAWRLLHLMLISRLCPNLVCTQFYGEVEWKSVYALVYNRPPPEKAPSLVIITRAVAVLGGFLNRKSDGGPGAQVLWRGMQRLRDIALSWTKLNMVRTYG